MGVRFLHTADWQLGKAFASFGPDAGVHLRDQRVQTVRQLADLATQLQVDAVLVAGDVFEEQLVSLPTITGCLGALERFRGDWVLLPGNHDAAAPGSVWERAQPLLARLPAVHLALAPEPIAVAQGRLAVLPAPLLRRHESADASAWWDNCSTPEAAFRVGLAHGSVVGVLPEASEANNPIAPDRAVTARLDYLALGDWHGARRISDRTWYSGTPEPDRFKENDAGNVLLVEISAPGATPTITPIPVAHYRWTLLDRLLQSRGDAETLDRDLAAAAAPDAGRQVLRLILRGALPLPDQNWLQDRLDWWRGQFLVLEVEDGELRPLAAAGDFDALDPPGYVADAVALLRAQAAAGDATAAGALSILYRLCAAAGETP